MNWNTLLKQIERGPDCTTHVTNVETWRMLVPALKAYGFSAPEATTSNLFSIIREVKKALRANDVGRIMELFSWAESMTNFQLRVALGVIEPIHVPCSRVGGQVRVNLTPIQFEELQKRSGGYFIYRVPG